MITGWLPATHNSMDGSAPDPKSPWIRPQQSGERSRSLRIGTLGPFQWDPNKSQYALLKSQQNPSVLGELQPTPRLVGLLLSSPKKSLLLNSNSNSNVYTKLNIYVYGLTPLYSPWNPRNLKLPNFWSRVKATQGRPHFGDTSALICIDLIEEGFGIHLNIFVAGNHRHQMSPAKCQFIGNWVEKISKAWGNSMYIFPLTYACTLW